MFCPNCGSRVAAGSASCPTCGTSLAGYLENVPPPPPPPHPAPLVPAPMMQAPPGAMDPVSDKSKVVAGLLQIFLGAFGAGRFYTGHPAIAIAQIVVTWLTCVGYVWPLVDGILMLTGKVNDSDGRPLRD